MTTGTCNNSDVAAGPPPRLGVHHGTANPMGVRHRFFNGWFGQAAFYFMLAMLFNGEAEAADKLRLAVQKTGTFAWELEIIKARGLDKQAGLDIEITEFASPEATKIALMGGAADIILSDWLWVAQQRHMGGQLVFFPYSTALGAVMVEAASPITDLDGLKGKKIAVAGGPLDKSWLLLQAFARQSHFDIASEANVVYGAPALLYQKAASGEADATLNYWNFCVALESRGFRRLIGMDEVERRLGAKGPVAMVGYVFDADFARSHAEPLARFLKIAAEVKGILAHSDGDWDNIAQQIGIDDRNQLALYRQSYRDGIPKRPVEEEAADARVLYRALAEAGGGDAAGPAKEFDEEIYYKDGPALAPRKN
jgi:NitT/TauT family transport system substrate-binding protein